MTKWMCLGAGAVLLITAVTGPWMLRHRVAELETISRALLDAPSHTGAFRDVAVNFAGQEARLTGIVGSEADRALAGEIISDRVRIPGGISAGWNPVIAVKGEVSVDPAWNLAHPKPWLSILVYRNKVELRGITKSPEQGAEIRAALQRRLPDMTFLNAAISVPDARPALDWADTVASMPDQASIIHARTRGAFYFTEGDGRWNAVDGSLNPAEETALLAKAEVDADRAKLVVAGFISWRDREAEAFRIASLPPARAAFILVPDGVVVNGFVGDTQDRDSLLDGLRKRFPDAKLSDEVRVSGEVRPHADWSASLDSLPQQTQPPMIAGLMPETTALIWNGKGGDPAMRSALAPFARDSRDLAPVLWQWFTAREDARKRAKITASILPPSAPPALPGSTDAFVGWTFANDRISLFGSVPDQATELRVLQAAGAAFPDHLVDAANLRVDPARHMSSGSSIRFEKLPTPPKPLIGISTFDGKSKVYPADAYDSEIARDFRDVPVPAADLTVMLRTFRESLVSRNELAREAPFLSLLADGKTLHVSGEVAAEADKQRVLDAIRKGTRGPGIVDDIRVTPLVSESGDIQPTLASLPIFAKGARGVASVRPGQKWRVAVVHAVYFPKGSDRSKDQERALRQVREVLRLLPGAKFEIVGHTDNTGDAKANLRLSGDRAAKFESYLADAGIPRDVVSARGAGSAQPIAGNDTEEGRSLNRRVDVILH